MVATAAADVAALIGIGFVGGGGGHCGSDSGGGVESFIIVAVSIVVILQIDVNFDDFAFR